MNACVYWSYLLELFKQKSIMDAHLTQAQDINNTLCIAVFLDFVNHKFYFYLLLVKLARGPTETTQRRKSWQGNISGLQEGF